MVKVISFSGSCLSGKTTTMLDLKRMLESDGLTVAIAEEPIRSILDEHCLTIDDLRNDADKFIFVQKQVLEQRTQNEILAINHLNGKYKDFDYLFIDRSAADVFFYITFYFDKSLLKTDEQLKEYRNLLKHLKLYIKKSYYTNNKILLFKPLKNIYIEDSYRPKQMSDEKKFLEFDMIKFYNYLFFDLDNIIPVDMNKSTELKNIYNLIK